ncbi:PREDICTED: uncharacterized protein LOC109158075 [Ipomoea nil]|uniref:uncharacterized protein LOC109158075 n=1 Tax=Ipomoea nil TaxID=35883 RepID=UPI0009014083|nr:PREDICTED: uncharacterized protein LOC109158075 [Ipomoea nil]
MLRHITLDSQLPSLQSTKYQSAVHPSSPIPQTRRERTETRLGGDSGEAETLQVATTDDCVSSWRAAARRRPCKLQQLTIATLLGGEAATPVRMTMSNLLKLLFMVGIDFVTSIGGRKIERRILDKRRLC